MQVKKFEARTVKEALEMVKNSLGPDAIILAVRDNSNRFGLVGEGSVEVTAAVSDFTLRKKQFVESRLNDKHKEVFTKAPARVQKEIIDKMVKSHVEAQAPQPRKLTARPYIEITDDHDHHAMSAGRMHAVGGRNVSDMLHEVNDAPPVRMPQAESGLALQRIRSAARDAWAAVQETVEPVAVTRPATAPQAESEAEIEALRKEISSLKKVIQEFRHVPQKFVTVHPGAEAGIPFELSFMFEKLNSSGISAQNIQEILFEAQKELPVLHVKKKAMVEAWVAQHMLNGLRVQAQPLEGRVHVFVGGSGQGKTSTLVKMAGHLVVEKRKRIAIVTTDSFKVGAVEQLRIYSQILNVPFVVIRERSDWPKVLTQLAGYDHILADSPGLQLKDAHEIDLIKRLTPPEEVGAKIHFVLSCNLKDSDAFENARRYQVTGYEDVIFTCIDESVQHGLIYNFQKEFAKPLHSFGIGPRIPEDFEAATKERVLDLIFKLSKVGRETRQAL